MFFINFWFCFWCFQNLTKKLVSFRLIQNFEIKTWQWWKLKKSILQLFSQWRRKGPMILAPVANFINYILAQFTLPLAYHLKFWLGYAARGVNYAKEVLWNDTYLVFTKLFTKLLQSLFQQGPGGPYDQSDHYIKVNSCIDKALDNCGIHSAEY